ECYHCKPHGDRRTTTSLASLEKMPACNVQLLGAKKKALAGFSTVTSQFHVGYIKQTEVFLTTPPALKMRACQILGAKSTLATCVDSNPPYKFKWTEKTAPVAKGIDNDIYSIVDAFQNACEMWKAIKRLKQEWQRFVTLVKQSQELKTVSYHKLYDILKQHHNEVNKIRAERLARTANPLALVAQQQPVYHPQNHPNHYTQNSSTRSQPTATRSREKEIDKLVALISLSFKKIYKPTNNNLKTSSNTNRANQDNSPRINKGTGYDNQKVVNVAGARENVDAADNSGPIFDAEPLQKVQNDDNNYNVFDNDQEHPEQPEYVNELHLVEQDEHNIIIDSLDMSYDREQDDQDDTDDLAKERDLLAFLTEKLKCEIDDNKNCNKYLESSNKALVDKLKEEMVADLRYFNSLEHEVESLKSQLETQKIQFLNEIDGISKEYYYADHMNAILGVYTTLDEFTDLQCDYVDQVVKCERLEKELSKSNTTSKSFEAL
nr:U4/U6 small nuclear ribonucleoprotein Prp31 homolog [Tanacetum cinerariifolium]